MAPLTQLISKPSNYFHKDECLWVLNGNVTYGRAKFRINKLRDLDNIYSISKQKITFIQTSKL